MDEPDERLAQQLEGVAKSAFTAEGAPRDLEEHIRGVGSLIIASNGNIPIGFASAIRIGEDKIVQHGVAVKKSYQGRGIGSQLLDRAVSDLSGQRTVFASRTQHPGVVSYYLGKSEFLASNELATSVADEFSSFWPGELDEGFVLRDSFEQQLYTDEDLRRFEKEIAELTGLELDMNDGDALIAVADRSEG